MKKSMHISLRAGERIYINGAVLRVDRKVTLELLNDAAFLLENQVMQYEEAVTPLRQLYFIVQLMLIEPSQALAKSEPFKRQLIAVLKVEQQLLIGAASLRLLFKTHHCSLFGRRVRSSVTYFPTASELVPKSGRPIGFCRLPFQGAPDIRGTFP